MRLRLPASPFMRILGWIFVALLIVLPRVGSSQPSPVPPSDRDSRLDVIPDALRPWIPWVLRDSAGATCPLMSGASVCIWPGRATFDLDQQGGRFELRLHADAEVDVSLPGDARNWPQDVTVDGVPALMSFSYGTPRLRVERGDHVVAGRFEWPRMPEALVVPVEIALIDVRVNDAPLGRVRREANGAVWLNAAPTEQNEADSLTVDVWRRFTDGVPLELTTRVHLRVGGDPREIDLGIPLPDAFAAWRLDSPLPARIDEQGHLRVQLRAGDWTVDLFAASVVNRPSIVAAMPASPWPTSETWTFVSNDRIRSVRLGGATPIDPARTSLPPEWQGAPTFALTAGESLEITELRRGEPTPPPPALTLSRRMWLDHGGAGLIVQDELNGAIYEGGRLNVAAPAHAGRIALSGAGQVISSHADATGVEVRSGNLNLSADLRYDSTAGELPAVGWDQDVQSLTVALQVPPGWRLLTASGPDRADGAWLQRWTLYDLFILLVTAVVAARLFGLIPALGLLVVVGLSWHEASSVRGLWLAMMVVAAIAAALPVGRLRTLFGWARTAMALALVLSAVGFAWTELRTGIFPQLESGDPRWGVADSSTSLFKANDYDYETTAEAPPPTDYYANTVTAVPAMPAAPPEAAEQVMDALEGEDGSIRGPGTRGDDDGRYRAGEMLNGGFAVDLRNMPQGATGYDLGILSSVSRTSQVDPNAVVQTGPGVPQWNWRQYTLTWAGPVSSEDTIRLWLIPPSVDLLLSLVRAFGALWLAFVFVRGRREKPVDHGSPSAAAAVAVVLVAVGLAAAPSPAQAQVWPGSTVLDELRNVLLAAPACTPNCVEVPQIELRADAAGISFDAEVHVEASSSWPLPGPDSAWIPSSVSIDGIATDAIYRDSAGYLFVRLEPGIHHVRASGEAAASVALGFSVPVRVMDWTVDGWTLDGYRADEAPPSSVQLRRTREDGAPPTTEAGGPTGVASRFAVSRTLDIGVPMVTHSAITRLGRADESTVVRIPLLTGETVTTAGMQVEDGDVVVTFAPGVNAVEWDANLAETASLSLEAPAGVPWTESWTMLCSPVWHCTAAGMVATVHMVNGTWAPTFNPWPGERLDLTFERPAPVDGASLTIDTAELNVVAGRRIRTSTLSVALRASRGGEQTIVLDAASDIRSFAIDGVSRPFELVDGRLAYTVEPGAHTVAISWQDSVEAGTVVWPPSVDLGTPTANARISLTVPDNRWVVWTGRATWGPVVRFWEFAIVLLIAAFALGRFMPVPVSVGAWFLLGLGMTQVEPAAPVAVVAWFAIVGLRPRWRERVPAWVHNMLQIATVIVTFYAVSALLRAVAEGLALRPPSMHIEGGGSCDSELVWTEYSSGSVLPTPVVLWLPIWAWRATMLLWSAWLAFAVVRWARWGWNAFGDGGLWRRLTFWGRHPRHAQPAVAPAVSAAAVAEPPTVAVSDGTSSPLE